LVSRIAHELVDSWYPETIVAYEAMDKRLFTQFQRCDKKTRLAYLGRPDTRQIERVEQQVRYRKSGTITYKDHTFTHRLPAKKGYLELFGLATLFTDKKGKAWFRLHYTIQETLTPAPLTQRVNVAIAQNESKIISLPLNRLPSQATEQPQVNVTYSEIDSETEKRESILTERENRRSVKVTENSAFSSISESESNLTAEELRILSASRGVRSQ